MCIIVQSQSSNSPRHAAQEDLPMDQIQTRIDALEQQMHTVTRRLRWWRGLAVGFLVLAVLTWALPSGQAADGRLQMIADELAALRDILTVIRFDPAAKEVVITGANLRLVNGLGQTGCEFGGEPSPPDCPNGLGNLIVGYNEPRPPELGENFRTGSHNVVVGLGHNFSSFGGLVVGEVNTISGVFASVSGGQQNTASGNHSSVSGGFSNMASGFAASVTGGTRNLASGERSAVSGGEHNTASGDFAAVSGGLENTASQVFASVSGGRENTASGDSSSVSGGFQRTAEGEFDWVAGSLVEDE
jgi:hypothetical protein